MTDYVLEQSNNKNMTVALQDDKRGFINIWSKIFGYANFLKQPLEKWMFVACKLVDGVWVVLEEPEKYSEWLEYKDKYKYGEFYKEKCQEYQQAKERCLFEGFELFPEYLTQGKYTWDIRKLSFVLCYNLSDDLSDEWVFNTKFKLIEDLVEYNLQLTPIAQKQINE